jgi:hypothetical protein
VMGQTRVHKGGPTCDTSRDGRAWRAHKMSSTKKHRSKRLRGHDEDVLTSELDASTMMQAPAGMSRADAVTRQLSRWDAAPGDASAAPPLPLPWIVLINQADGRPYYHNPLTNVSQWEYPQRAPLPPGPPPQMTPEDMMMQQQVQENRRMQQMQANMQEQQQPPPWFPLAARMEWNAQQTSMTPSTPPEEMMQMEQEDKRLRFVKNDRVACRIEGRWATGSVASLNEDDPSDETGQTKLPYVCRA